MYSSDFSVDWDYLKQKMREKRGGGSVRDLAEMFPLLSATTCHRFLAGSHELDLKSLLCVINVLDLELHDVFVVQSIQLDLTNKRMFH